MYSMLKYKNEAGFWFTLLLTIYALVTQNSFIKGGFIVLLLVQFRLEYLSFIFSDQHKISAVQAVLKVAYMVLPRSYLVSDLSVFKVTRLWGRGESCILIRECSGIYSLERVSRSCLTYSSKKALNLLSGQIDSTGAHQRA